MKFLVVDDQDECRTIMERLLRRYGDVVTVSNGFDALTEIKKTMFDVIFLDVEMRGMNGLELLHHLREVELNAGISLGHGVKIVICTAHKDGKTLFSAFEEFCDEFLAKPITKEKIDNVVSRLG